MTNEELFKHNVVAMMSAWKEYGKIVEAFLAKTKSDGKDHEMGGFARRPILNPFAWLYKTCDTALLPEFTPGGLVKDSRGRYGVILKTEVGQAYDHEWRVNCMLVDFKGTCGEMVVEAEGVEKAEFPPELVEFALSGKGGLKEKVHEKVEEAFNA